MVVSMLLNETKSSSKAPECPPVPRRHDDSFLGFWQASRLCGLHLRRLRKAHQSHRSERLIVDWRPCLDGVFWLNSRAPFVAAVGTCPIVRDSTVMPQQRNAGHLVYGGAAL